MPTLQSPGEPERAREARRADSASRLNASKSAYIRGSSSAVIFMRGYDDAMMRANVVTERNQLHCKTHAQSVNPH